MDESGSMFHFGNEYFGMFKQLWYIYIFYLIRLNNINKERKIYFGNNLNFFKLKIFHWNYSSDRLIKLISLILFIDSFINK